MHSSPTHMALIVKRLHTFQPKKWLCALFIAGMAAFGGEAPLPYLGVGWVGLKAVEMAAVASPTPAPATPTPLPDYTPTATPFLPPTATATPIPLPSHTPGPPPALLPLAWSSVMRPGAQPQTYLDDACRYLRQRWDPNNSPPGTLVVPIMFHAIVPSPWHITRNNQMTLAQFTALTTRARELGFETITTAQLVDFLLNNAPIPPRSLMLILDDNLLDTLKKYMLPVLEEYDWTVTLAYIAGIDRATEWSTLESLAAAGRVDVQSHGFLHNGRYIKGNIAVEIIHEELYKPIPVLAEHLGYPPQAYIWPGGDYNQVAVKMAREAGYQLGFTAYPRGPLMFNWIPLGADEQSMGDPLLVLPRYWSPRSEGIFDEAVQISLEAQAEAELNREGELTWYQANCNK